MIRVYGIVDRKAGEVINIFTSPTDETAIRSFKSLLASPRSFFNDFYKDFSLFKVCELSFDKNSLNVSEQDIHHVTKSGFMCNSFVISEPLLAGYDIEVGELSSLVEKRFPQEDNSNE